MSVAPFAVPERGRDAQVLPLDQPCLCHRTAHVGAAGAALMGTLALAGWWAGAILLATGWPGYTPMAPATAVALLALAAGIVAESCEPGQRSDLASAAVVGVIVVQELLAAVTASPPLLARLLLPAAQAGLENARISPVTAIALLLASLGLLFVARRDPWGVGAALACVVTALGGLVTLGYGLGLPFLVAGPVKPVALPTGLALVFLGVALLGLCPRESPVVRLVTGPSTRARLLRAFLPLVAIIVGIDVVVGRFSGVGLAASSTLAEVLLVTMAAAWIARSLGRELDLTEEVRAAAHRDAERLAAIVRSSADAIYTKDLEGRVVAWNASAERVYGWTAAEIVGRASGILVPPEAIGSLDATRSRIAAGESVEHGETVRLRKDGRSVTVAVSESPLHDSEGRVVGSSVIARDLSRQREAEQALDASRNKLRALFESDLVGIVFGTWTGAITDANDRFLDIVGYTREDLAAGLSWKTLTAPGFDLQNEKGNAEVRARGACTPYEKQYVRRDGRRVWVLVGYAAIPSDPSSSVAFVLDIDDRKREAEERRCAEERFARLLHSEILAVGIAELESGRLVEVSERCAEFFGYAREEMVGRTVFELDLWADPATRARLVKASATPGGASGEEAVFRRRSGELRHALVSLERLTLPGRAEALTMLVLTDLTEHRKLEDQFRQAQKMEAVGRLAGGIAHDFNNVLGVIIGYTELLLRTSDAKQRARLEQVHLAAERAAGLTRQLLTFSRRQVVEPRVLDLDALLTDVQKLLGRLIGEDVSLSIHTGGVGRVRADAGQIEQVVMNLCVNARDAMPDGGTLRIATSNEDVAAKAGLGAVPPGRYVVLAVQDTGCGMDVETQTHIFEPFFTTKGPGKGTGLGLATVYGVVKQAGGHIAVESAPGRGTTFRVYLPRVDDVATPTVTAEAPAPVGRGETILLVEDEPSLRATTREVLEGHGYAVLEAASGVEALACATCGDAVDLVLTDVVMPGLNGRELAEELRRQHPTLPVLYMSGYSNGLLGTTHILDEDIAFLEKPFTADQLLCKLHDVLAAEAPIPT